MVANALDDSRSTRVADAEAFPGDAVEISLTAGRAVESDVSDDDVFFGLEACVLGRIDDDLRARQPFSDVVVGISFEPEGHAWRSERSERLAGAANEFEVNGILGESLATVFA